MKLHSKHSQNQCLKTATANISCKLLESQSMIVTNTKITDVKIIRPTIFEDERGFFFESFNRKKFEAAIGHNVTFVQDNHSKSTKGVLRGLHYQLPPHAQGKLVRVIQGKVFDVAVDIRKSSPTFGQWVGETLSAENKKQLWVPKGFAHGFLTLSETADFLYKTTDYYSPLYERSIRWDDALIGVNWVGDLSPSVSTKDQSAAAFDKAEVFP